MPGSHARLSPSSAHRWTACPAAPGEEAGTPDSAGLEAAIGTVFHHFAAICLEEGREPEEFIGEAHEVDVPGKDGKPIRTRIEFDEEMAEAMHAGLDALRDEMADPSARMYVEKRVPLTSWLGEKAFGTADAIIVLPSPKRMIVFDWKYGRGVPVAPEENKQGLLYALGAWTAYAPEEFKSAPETVEVEIWIEQPRCPGGGGCWSTTGDKLLEWGEFFREAAAATRAPEPAYNPGEDTCKWCSAKTRCEARAQFLLELVNADYDELADEATFGENTGPISKEMRTKILLNKKMIEQWLERLHADAISELMLGKPVPGLKLVPGRRGPRHIPVEVQPEAMEVAEEVFGDAVFQRKLLPVSKLEKMLGKENFDRAFGHWVKQNPPKPILVPEDDKREAIAPASSLFDDDDVS